MIAVLYENGDNYHDFAYMMENYAIGSLYTALSHHLYKLGTSLISQLHDEPLDNIQFDSYFLSEDRDSSAITIKIGKSEFDVSNRSDFLNALLDGIQVVSNHFDGAKAEAMLLDLPVQDIQEIPEIKLIDHCLPESSFQNGIPLSPRSTKDENSHFLFYVMKSEPMGEWNQEAKRYVSQEIRQSVSYLQALSKVFPEISEQAKFLETLEFKNGQFELNGQSIGGFDKVLEAIQDPDKLKYPSGWQMKP